MSGGIELRPLSLPEVEVLLDWAKTEGWNPGLADASAFLAADPEGFIGCFVDGEMAAGISAVRYGDDFGFIGLYIAHPSFRGQGHGRRVWSAGMQHLTGRTVGLDGVPEQQANYRSMGFEAAYETHRWSGTLAPGNTGEVRTAGPSDSPAILAYDRDLFPASRNAFLNEWLHAPRVVKLLVRSGQVGGYAVCRRCHEGWKIGPLFADTPSDAEQLLLACAVEAGGEMLQIDVPEVQREFANRLRDLGFSQGFTTARMYRGPKPDIHLHQVFGITTLELG
jgi:GNAT superfamily N-acetyltransferase